MSYERLVISADNVRTLPYASMTREIKSSQEEHLPSLAMGLFSPDPLSWGNASSMASRAPSLATWTSGLLSHAAATEVVNASANRVRIQPSQNSWAAAWSLTFVIEACVAFDTHDLTSSIICEQLLTLLPWQNAGAFADLYRSIS